MISILILTKNEEQDLPGCLASVAWSDDIHVFDSFSDDRTVEISLAAGARVTQRKFDGYASQRNAALDIVNYKYPWLLILDADERIPGQLVPKLQEQILKANGSLDVYQADVVWSTGILRARQLAQEVQAASCTYSPHTWGDGLVLLANLHVAAAVSTAPFIEYPFDPPTWTPERRDYVLPRPTTPDTDGYLTLSDAPGLGVKIDWDAIEPLRIDVGIM